VIQDSQNVCKHGRYFGTWKVSRQMEHFSKFWWSSPFVAIFIKKV
jgi:hypothetical protein